MSPLFKQFLVAGSTLLAALSAGVAIGYPSVLLQQLKSNDTIIELNLHNGSWIGSVHGLAGIPSILLTILMQYKGRKCAFLLSSTCIFLGWIIIFFASNVSILILGEFFHGFGATGILPISFSTISEVVQPKYRHMCLIMYPVGQSFGMALIGILGRYLYWKTICLVMCCPIFMTFIIACAWPESPAWLAYKGELVKCKLVFNQIRGCNEESQKELTGLINSYQTSMKTSSQFQQKWVKQCFQTIVRRNFYLPMLHSALLINVTYWGGILPVLIYSSDMMQKLSTSKVEDAKLIMDISFIIGYVLATIAVQYFSSKNVMLVSITFSGIFMLLTAVTSAFQSYNLVGRDSKLGIYFLLAFFIISSLGSGGIGFSIASELMPVKHRGYGGCFTLICTCLLHSTTLKAYPYLTIYLNLWGTLFIYASCMIISAVLIGIYIPETKNVTLYEIEEYYERGCIKVNDIEKKFNDADISLIATKTVDDRKSIKYVHVK